MQLNPPPTQYPLDPPKRGRTLLGGRWYEGRCVYFIRASPVLLGEVIVGKICRNPD